MIEKVNPMHPDKVADRIAGAIVDLAYQCETNPKIAVEVLIGHGECNIIIESSVDFNNTLSFELIRQIVLRISKETFINVYINCNAQDKHLANNQENAIRCGDNGIFRGMPLTNEQKYLSAFVKGIYEKIPFDGKYIFANSKMIICQSNVSDEQIFKALLEVESEKKRELLDFEPDGEIATLINPLGEWIGGLYVDSGATNRKLGSDMADSVTGGGLHGKDLSKADVSVNIYAFLKAQEIGQPVELFCAIGDEQIDGKPYSEIVEIARKFIEEIGGFEKFAEWGLF